MIEGRQKRSDLGIGDNLLRKVLAIVLILSLYLSSCHGTEENDLWLLLSSYEDISITVSDLAFFLATHGFDAKPEKSYVVVKFSSGKEVYLTPNGAAPGLADLWMTPPSSSGGPTRVISSDAVKVNVTYNMTTDQTFIKKVSRYVIFPVTPLGMCYDGSQKLFENYKSFGVNMMYLFDPAGFNSQGHLWIALEDKGQPNTWLAIDSYYGVMTNDEYYYHAPYSFSDFSYLDSVNPRWRVA